MKKYILQGNEADVDKVVRENRIRVARRLIEFIPCDEESSEDIIDDDLNNGEDEETHLSGGTMKIILEPLKKEEGTTDTPIADSKEVIPGDTKDLPESDSKEIKEDNKPKGKKSKSEKQ